MCLCIGERNARLSNVAVGAFDQSPYRIWSDIKVKPYILQPLVVIFSVKSF